jgi:predicted MFS family arabinose efflux permease
VRGPIRRFLHPSHSEEIHDHTGLLTAVRWTGNTTLRYSAPFISVIGRGLGVSLDSMGVALSAGEVAGVTGPFIGRAVDSRSRRSAMVLGMTVLSAGAFLASASTTVIVFAVAIIAVALGKLLFDAAMETWFAERVDYERRGQVMGLTEVSWALAMLVGVTLLGLLTAATNWRVAFLAAGIGASIATVVLWSRLPVEPPHEHHHQDRVGLMPLVRAHAPAFVAFGLLMTSSNCLFVTFGAWLGDAFGFSTVAVAVTSVLLGLGELGATVAAVRFTDTLGKRRAIQLGAIAMVPCGIGLAFVGHHTVIGLVLLTAYFMAFEFAIISGIPLISELEPSAPASSIGVSVGFGTVGRGAAAIISTRLYTHYGFGASAATGVACALGVSLLFGFFVREPG